MTRTLPADTILTSKSQPFSIVWADNTDSICDLPSVLTLTTMRATATTEQTQIDHPRRPTEVLVGLLTVRQPLPPSHLPPLSHGILSLPEMLLRLHLLIPQESLRASPFAQGTSSIASQSQDLSLFSVQLPRDPSSRHAGSAYRLKRSALLSHGEYMGRAKLAETVLRNLRCVQLVQFCGYLSARSSTRCILAASCSTASPLGITLAMRKSRSSKRH